MNNAKLIALAERVARLNPDCAEIGAGMLASLVADAQDALRWEPPEAGYSERKASVLWAELQHCHRAMQLCNPHVPAGVARDTPNLRIERAGKKLYRFSRTDGVTEG